MATSNQVTSLHKARLLKLQNKKSQLGNLLRKRDQLTYQIKVLQKSISKEQKRTLKEISLLNQNLEKSDSERLTLLKEGGLLESESDDLEEVLRDLFLIRQELDSILEISLIYEELEEE